MLSRYQCTTSDASTEEGVDFHPAWGGSHDINPWLKVPSCHKKGEDETQISLAATSNVSKDFSIHINTTKLKFPAPVSARSLFQSAVHYVEFHVPAEFIVINHESMHIEATVYEAFVPLHVMICVRPTTSDLASEAIFSSICRRDIVCFHRLFLRAKQFLEMATTSSDVYAPSELEFLDFELEDENEEVEDKSAKACTAAEAALEPFIAQLSSYRPGDREEAASMLAAAASGSLGRRRLIDAMIARQSVLSAVERLLRPKGSAQENVCPEATRYPILSLLVWLTKGNYMEVEVAQALHSVVAELDLCHCSALVHTELTSALGGLCHIIAGQD